MTIELPPVQVRTLPEHILTLSASDRLYHCIGKIAVEWQTLIEAMAELTRLFNITKNEGKKSLPSFSVMSNEWRTIAKACPAIPDSNRPIEIMALACNYQKVRDALIHGTPSATTMVHNTGSNDEIVRIDIASDKAVYQQHVRDRSSRYFKQYGMKDHNISLGDWLKIAVGNKTSYELYYSQQDIEFIAAHGLPSLVGFVSHTSRIVVREIMFAGIEPLVAATALVMQPLPRTVHRLTKLEVSIPGDNLEGLRIRV